MNNLYLTATILSATLLAGCNSAMVKPSSPDDETDWKPQAELANETTADRPTLVYECGTIFDPDETLITLKAYINEPTEQQYFKFQSFKATVSTATIEQPAVYMINGLDHNWAFDIEDSNGVSYKLISIGPNGYGFYYEFDGKANTTKSKATYKCHLI